MTEAAGTPEYEAFRDSVRAFLARHVAPFHRQWERDGQVNREVWRAAGEAGLLGIDVPVEFGGGGVADFRFPEILNAEIVRAGATGLGFALHNDVVTPYLLGGGTPEQKQRWLPGFCSGELITAIAMTEPGAGSDLAAIRTTAVRDGDDYVLNGTKTFITNGVLADLVIVAAKTGARGITLFVVESGMPGFTRGRPLDKIGMHAQDTAELFFTDVRVPAANRLGRDGRGLLAIADNLPRERLSIAAYALAGAEVAVERTVEHCKQRVAFGQPIGALQHVRFEIAEMATECDVTRAYIDRCIAEYNVRTLDAATAAKAKWWATDLQKRVIDRCLQLHGGYGYMSDHPIAKSFVDTRVHAIYGGTNEIMKETIGRAMGL